METGTALAAQPSVWSRVRDRFFGRSQQPDAVRLLPVLSAPTLIDQSKRDAELVHAAAERKLQAAKRLYAAAEQSRLTSDWFPINTSADAEIRTSLRVLRSRSRQVVRDSEWGQNAQRLVKDNVVGTGIAFQAQVMKRNKKLDDEKNTAIEEEFAEWCKAECCDVSGKLEFAELCRILMAEIMESGEVLVRKVKGKPFGRWSRVPMALEVIEADQLVDEWNGRTEEGREVRMGVEVDEWQRPVAYWLYPRHPGDYQFVPGVIQTNRLMRVPANEIIHLYVPERAKQTRGVPWLHAGLKRLHNMEGLEEAEIVKARSQACVMGLIETPEVTDPNNPPNGGASTTDIVNGQRVMDMQPAQIRELAPGEKFVGFNPSSPNPQFDPFLRFMLRAVAAAIGCSYEALSRDYSQSNYSSSRLALLAERDVWKSLQTWFVNHFLQLVYADWLEMAVLSGVLSFPDYETNTRRYLAVRWKTRGWDWIDPLKEVTAARMAVRAGFTTQADVIAAKGDDYEDVFQQRRRELDLADELELIFDTDVEAVNDKGATQTAAPTDDPSKTATGADEGNGATETDSTDTEEVDA